ncbi:alpha-amylase family protein [Sunxiuqinia indica]|uniref:hypothetical protein n=1 Tax=Sunxiuqinia indica TaxID=2692584 RepID=UPI00135A6314|nr:hypothetical protein [Sunxiuqinia indica]
MIKLKLSILLILICSSIGSFSMVDEKTSWKHASGNFNFQWDLENDQAKTVLQTTGQQIWSGSVLPAFLIEDEQKNRQYIKAEVSENGISTENDQTILALNFGEFATGEMIVSKQDWGVGIEKLSLKWTNSIPNIIDLYFGTSMVSEEGKAFLDADEIGFRGDWSAAGFCVPGAKEGTAQSYFRMWDFGQTTIALGNYGPSMGTLYGAAFPRPVLGFAMGNDNGWTAFGAGSIPNAAMLLQLRNIHGYVKYVYREDLWGAGEQERVWEQPLRITFGENSWLAFRDYFNSFPPKEPISEVHSKSIWNTWGNWKNKEYPIRPMVDFAKKVGAELFIVDDPWEESQGLGRPSFERFPNFYEDFQYVDDNQMHRGVWETLGWITDTAKAGLTSADLIVNKDGIPCKSSWSFDPFGDGFYCIDVSSERSRKFLRERTIWTMENVKPKIIKLDFGYGMPSPNMGVPRNPAIRGERYSFELFKLIVNAAKSVDPDVTIMYYGINPLFLSVVEMVSLDDQGDLWHAVKEGHDQWSIWASLLSNKQVVVSGSSGYDWHKDDNVILNSIILGIPGAVLGTHLDDGSSVPKKYLNRRLAVYTWYRKNVQWEPVWLNSHVGDLTNPPEIKCWGREDLIEEEKVLTTLILNGSKDESIETLKSIEWQGRWAVISQTDESIFNSSKLAVVPFDAGSFSIQLSRKPSSVQKLSVDGIEPCSDWKWENGSIIFEVDDTQLAETAGFIIQTN